MDQVPQIAQDTEDEQDAEHDRELHPDGPRTRRPWWWGRCNQRGRVCRNDWRRRRRRWGIRHIVFHSGGKLSHGTVASKCDSRRGATTATTHGESTGLGGPKRYSVFGK